MSEPVPQRIGDTDRDQAADCLREHLAQGRLSQDEFDDRITMALAAKTAADLEPLFADLPEPRPDHAQGCRADEYAVAGLQPAATRVPAPRPAAARSRRSAATGRPG